MQFLYLLVYNRYLNFFLRWMNKGLASFLPLKFKIPPSGVIQLYSGKNRFKLATNQTSYLTHLLFWHGPASFEYTTIFKSLIRKMDTFFDVGSNIGYYTVLACAENNQVNVHSFEPAVGSFTYLKKNVAINNIEQQVKAEETALTDISHSLTFHEAVNNKYQHTRYVLSGESNASTKELNREFRIYEVKGITLDEYCEKNAINSIGLIKIDTEGAELNILKGGCQTISSQLPIIICEIHHDFNKEKIESIMQDMGYEFYLYNNNKLEKADTLTGANYDEIRNWFMVHPGKYSLIEEYVTG